MARRQGDEAPPFVSKRKRSEFDAHVDQALRAAGFEAGLSPISEKWVRSGERTLLIARVHSWSPHLVEFYLEGPYEDFSRIEGREKLIEAGRSDERTFDRTLEQFLAKQDRFEGGRAFGLQRGDNRWDGNGDGDDGEVPRELNALVRILKSLSFVEDSVGTWTREFHDGSVALVEVVEGDGTALHVAWGADNGDVLSNATFDIGSMDDIIEEVYEIVSKATKQPKLRGMAGMDDGVSDDCDLGACERCTTEDCEHRCHFVASCSKCGANYSNGSWAELQQLGVQKVDADEWGPAEVLVLKNCVCGSTLAV